MPVPCLMAGGKTNTHQVSVTFPNPLLLIESKMDNLQPDVSWNINPPTLKLISQSHIPLHLRAQSSVLLLLLFIQAPSTAVGPFRTE